MKRMERVGDLLLGDLHHPHPMLIFQIRPRIGDLTANCSCHNHLEILVHTASIPVIVATKYLFDSSLIELIKFGHSQVFLNIEVLLIFIPVLDEPRDVLKDHHM